MKNKILYYCVYVLMIITGALLTIIGIMTTYNSTLSSHTSGLIAGIGSALLGLGIGYLFIFIYNPKKRLKQITIENNDERNIMIKNKSLALAGQIANGLITALFVATVILNQVSWITWSLLCINLVHTIVFTFFYYKFQHKC